MNNNKLVYRFILVSTVSFLISLTFIRNYNMPLDSDLAAIALPVKPYQVVLDDPFGMNVLLHDSIYGATNRFFTHFFIWSYFRSAPFVLQNLFTPLDSVYYSCAIFKTIAQFFLIYLLALLVTNNRKIWDTGNLLITCLIFPLFQTYGYYPLMAIMDNSIVYVFFYAFSLALVILFFLPFFNAALNRTTYDFSWPNIILLIILTIVNAFSGPLNTAVLLLICSLTLLYFFVKNFSEYSTNPFWKSIKYAIKNIPSTLLYIFLFAIAISLYSYYIGRNNAENYFGTVTLAERYNRMIDGLIFHYTAKLGQPLLIGMVILNFVIIALSNASLEAKKMIVFLKWFFAISICYILLLPIGGFRVYRPNIIRYDTILPITLGLVFLYAYSTYYLIFNLKTKWKKSIYIFSIIIFSTIYINADFWFVIRKNNWCERESIQKLAMSNDSIVFIDKDCSILSWGKTLNPEDSRFRVEMLQYWNVVKGNKLYYQK